MFWDPKLFKMSQFFASLTSLTLTPNYSLGIQEICSTSHLILPSRPAARQHMRQHDENEKNESQNFSEWQVFVEILNFFRKAQGQLKLCFMMFFDVLKLWEPSWNDSGSILEHSFFHDFSSKFLFKIIIYDLAFVYAHCIDLRFEACNPN